MRFKMVVLLALLGLAATAVVGVAQQTPDDIDLPPTAADVSVQEVVDQSAVPSAELNAQLNKQTRRLGRGRVVEEVWAMPGDCFVVVKGDGYGVVTDEACRPQVEALVRKLEAQR